MTFSQGKGMNLDEMYHVNNDVFFLNRINVYPSGTMPSNTSVKYILYMEHIQTGIIDFGVHLNRPWKAMDVLRGLSLYNKYGVLGKSLRKGSRIYAPRISPFFSKTFGIGLHFGGIELYLFKRKDEPESFKAQRLFFKELLKRDPNKDYLDLFKEYNNYTLATFEEDKRKTLIFTMEAVESTLEILKNGTIKIPD